MPSRTPSKSGLDIQIMNNNDIKHVQQKGPQETQVIFHKQATNSLNYRFMRRQAQKIDCENLYLAKRIINKQALETMTSKFLSQDYQKKQKLNQSLKQSPHI